VKDQIMSVVVPMNKTALKTASQIEIKRRIESREASKNAKPGESKYLRRARARLNDRRNFHAKFPESKPGGHVHKAPGSMKK
jgi:hypothetical protein